MKRMIIIGLLLILATACAGGGGGNASSDGGGTTPKPTITEYIGAIVDQGTYLLVDLLDSKTLQIEKPSVLTIQDDGNNYLIGNKTGAYIDGGLVTIKSFNNETIFSVDEASVQGNVGVISVATSISGYVSTPNTDTYFYACADSGNGSLSLCSTTYDARSKSITSKAETLISGSSQVYTNESVICRRKTTEMICRIYNEDVAGLPLLETDKVETVAGGNTLANNFLYDGNNKVYMAMTTPSTGKELHYLNVDTNSSDFGTFDNLVFETFPGSNGSDFNQISLVTHNTIYYVGGNATNASSRLRSMSLNNGNITEYNLATNSLVSLDQTGNCALANINSNLYGTRPVMISSLGILSVADEQPTSSAATSAIGGMIEGVGSIGENTESVVRISSYNGGAYTARIKVQGCSSAWENITGATGTLSTVAMMGQNGTRLFMTVDDVAGVEKSLRYIEFGTTEMVDTGLTDIVSVFKASLTE